MYSNFSPVSSGDQRYEEPSSPLDFEEKAERLIAMQSSHINPVSPDLSSSSPNPCTATQQLHEDNATDKDSCSINVSTVTLDPANSASYFLLTSSSASEAVTSSSNTVAGALCSEDTCYQQHTVTHALVSEDVFEDQSDNIPFNCTGEFDMNEAAKRLFMTASNSPDENAKQGQEKKKKKKPSKEKSRSAIRFHANYQRHPKPPYPYTGMIIHAINSTTEKSLTLTGIISKLKEMFTFFKGSYTGWKDSVRHNLSHNACFVKGGRCSKPESNGNLWHVDISKAPINCFKLQDTPVAREGHWAQDLHAQIGFPEIHIPAKTPKPVVSTQEFPWTTKDDEDNSSSVYSDEAYSNFSPESNYAVPLSVTPPSTASDEFTSAPCNDSLTESREVPAFLSDTSFDDHSVGPVKSGKVLRHTRRYNPAWNKRNNGDVMKTIARKAARNVIHQSIAEDRKPLCPSAQYPQLPNQHLQYEVHHYEDQQHYPSSSYYPHAAYPTYEYPSAFQPYQCPPAMNPYPGYPFVSAFEAQPQHYAGYPYHHYQAMDWNPYPHPLPSWNCATYQNQFQLQTTDDIMTGSSVFSQEQNPVDLSVGRVPYVETEDK